MLLLVGLGNPDPKYSDTRHNVGFMAIDYLQKNLDVPNVVFKKSDEYMNNSGTAIKKQLDYYNLSTEDLFVIHDDLDLPLGEYKIQLSVGPKLHGGINSIEDLLKTSQFWRIRIGVDNRDPERRISGESYVLEDFRKEESEKLNLVLENIKSELTSLI